MEPVHAVAIKERSSQRYLVAVLLLIFLLSGASGLVYQIVWLKLLNLAFGVTLYAISTIFAGANFDVLKQPSVRLRVDDGRNFLLVTDRKYDVVTAAAGTRCRATWGKAPSAATTSPTTSIFGAYLTVEAGVRPEQLATTRPARSGETCPTS